MGGTIFGKISHCSNFFPVPTFSRTSKGWLEPRGVPPKVGTLTCRDASIKEHHGAVVIPDCGGGDGRNGARGGGEICSPLSENHIPVH